MTGHTGDLGYGHSYDRNPADDTDECTDPAADANVRDGGCVEPLADDERVDRPPASTGC